MNLPPILPENTNLKNQLFLQLLTDSNRKRQSQTPVPWLDFGHIRTLIPETSGQRLRLMQELGIKAIIRRKYVHRTSHEAAVSDGRIAENLLKRDFKADKPNQKWVTDVTQYRVFDEKIYLSAIKDLWNNGIVGFHISKRNDNPLVLETFRKAFKKHKDVTGMIVHSDQGYQYTSHAYHDMLPQVGAQISMSRRGNCYDNASIESFFSHLKVEALYPYDIRSIDEAQRRIEEYIRFYNEDRAQRKLNKLTPVEYRNQLFRLGVFTMSTKWGLDHS